MYYFCEDPGLSHLLLLSSEKAIRSCLVRLRPGQVWAYVSGPHNASSYCILFGGVARITCEPTHVWQIYY